MVRYIHVFFGIKVISRLIRLIYENIAKMANKIFNVPNHLKNLRFQSLIGLTPEHKVDYFFCMQVGKNVHHDYPSLKQSYLV